MNILRFLFVELDFGSEILVADATLDGTPKKCSERATDGEELKNRFSLNETVWDCRCRLSRGIGHLLGGMKMWVGHIQEK